MFGEGQEESRGEQTSRADEAGRRERERERERGSLLSVMLALPLHVGGGVQVPFSRHLLLPMPSMM